MAKADPQKLWREAEKILDRKIKANERKWFLSSQLIDELDEEWTADEIAEEFKRLDEHGITQPQPRHRPNGNDAPINYTGSEKEQMAAKCVAVLLNDQLSKLPDVRDFRSRLPGGIVMTTGAMHLFRCSPLTVLFSFDELETLGFQATDRDFRIKPIKNRWLYRYAIRRSGPPAYVCVEHSPGDLLQIKWGPYSAGGGHVEGAMTHDAGIGLGRRFSGPPHEFRSASPHRSRRLFDLLQMPGDKRDRWYEAHDIHDGLHVSGFRGTIMGQALQIASDISISFHITVDDALTFLLCGSTPPIRPALGRIISRPVLDESGKFQYSASVSVVVDAHPWASMEGVIKDVKEAVTPRFTASATGSTTTIRTATDIPIGTSLYCQWGTRENVGKTTKVTGSTYSSGKYTLTVDPLPASTARDDEFTYSKTQRTRLPDVDTMRTYLFVEEHAPGPAPRQWEGLVRSFNMEYGTKYKLRTFQQNYNRCREKIEETLLPRNDWATKMMASHEERAEENDLLRYSQHGMHEEARSLRQRRKLRADPK